jgi:hypothetical protein
MCPGVGPHVADAGRLQENGGDWKGKGESRGRTAIRHAQHWPADPLQEWLPAGNSQTRRRQVPSRRSCHTRLKGTPPRASRAVHRSPPRPDATGRQWAANTKVRALGKLTWPDRGYGPASQSRSETGPGLVTAPVSLLVPQVKLPERLDLAGDAEWAHDAVPGLIVVTWVEAR